MPQQITVFLFVAIMQKWYECRVNRSMNVQSVFTALIEMNAREDGWQFAALTNEIKPVIFRMK